MKKQTVLVSGFAGIGGFDLAAKWMGWESVVLCEIDHECQIVLRHHFPSAYIHGDIRTLTGKIIDEEIKRRFGDEPVRVVWCSGFPCFVGPTLIMTNNGLVPIMDIKVGDVVLTHLGNWKKVLNVGSKVAPTVTAKGQGHHGLVTTHEHPFWCRDKVSIWHNETRSSKMEFVGEPKWVDAKDMQGMFWGIPTDSEPLVVPLPNREGMESAVPRFNEHLMFLAGTYLGNGWIDIGKRRGKVLLGMGKKNHSRLEEAINGCGLHFTKSIERTTFKYHVSSRPLARWLKENFGSGAKEKSIPAWAIYGMDKEMRQSLLDGYIYTDGTPSTYKGHRNGWRTATTSRKLAVSSKMLGATLGYSVGEKYVRTAPTTVIEGRTVNQSNYWNVHFHEKSRTVGRSHGMLWQKCKSVTTTNEIHQVYNIEVEEDNSYIADGIAVHNCQPFSAAGKREGIDDNRYLWPEVARIIGEYRFDAIVLENVFGLTSILEPAMYAEMEREAVLSVRSCEVGLFDEPAKREKVEIAFEVVQQRVMGQILEDIEKVGYECPRAKDGSPVVLCVPACAVGAPHRRDRVWFVANRNRPDRDTHERRKHEVEKHQILGEEQGSVTPRVGEQDVITHAEGFGHNIGTGTGNIGGRESLTDQPSEDAAIRGELGGLGQSPASAHPKNGNDWLGVGGKKKRQEPQLGSDPEQETSTNPESPECELAGNPRRGWDGLADDNHAEHGTPSNPTVAGHEGRKQAGGFPDFEEEGAGVEHDPERLGGWGDASHTDGIGLWGQGDGQGILGFLGEEGEGNFWANFPTEWPLRIGDDGISQRLGGVCVPGTGKKVTASNLNKFTLKAGGNAIVPQVALQIFRALEATWENG